jgi:putative ABC transport system permease protein
MEALRQDLRYSFRSLAKKPGFTLVIILTLAIGVGANTAIFSVVNAVLLRALPFEQPERLVMVWGSQPRLGFSKNLISPATYFEWKEQNRSFSEMGAYTEAFWNLTGEKDPERIKCLIATPSLLSMLGAKMIAGRNFTLDETQPGHNRVAIIGSNFFKRRFSSQSETLGQTITLNGQNYTIVGILPSDFTLPGGQAELIIPFAPAPEQTNNRRARYLTVLARLSEGKTLEQAREEMKKLAAQQESQYPDLQAGQSVNVESFYKELVGQIEPALLVLFGAVGFLLLIACANVATILLTRASARKKEIAIRAALGATRLRIVRQLLTESILLSSMGGALGLLLGMWGIDLLVALIPDSIPRIDAVKLDTSVLLFTMLTSLFTGLLFGLFPALKASRVDLYEALKDAGKSTSSSSSNSRTGNALVVFEVAVSLVLLIGAGLMVKSFLLLQRVDPGFNPENGIAIDFSLPGRYRDEIQRKAFFRQVIESAEKLPGVEAVGITSHLPLSDENGSRSFSIKESTVSDQEEKLQAEFRRITPDYFNALGVQILRGREFALQDNAESPGVVIINQTLASQFFPNQEPIGKHLIIDDGSPRLREIIGIVKDVKHFSLEVEPKPELYVPFYDLSWPNMTMVVRTASDPTSIIGALRSEVSIIDKDVPLSNIKALDQYLDNSIGQQRFSMLLLGVFAIMALVLAIVGLYGVIAYSVVQRTHELGIRMALGAQPGDIIRLVIREGLILTTTGLVIGLIGAISLTRAMSKLLFSVSTTDPLTFIWFSLLLASVAIVACYIPARRATKVDPFEAIRYD